MYHVLSLVEFLLVDCKCMTYTHILGVLPVPDKQQGTKMIFRVKEFITQRLLIFYSLLLLANFIWYREICGSLRSRIQGVSVGSCEENFLEVVIFVDSLIL